MRLVGLLLLAGVTAPQAPLLTMRQLMLDVIHPAANDILLFVNRGEPKQESDWAALRHSAATLAESGNLLLAPERARDQGNWMKENLCFENFSPQCGTAMRREGLRRSLCSERFEDKSLKPERSMYLTDTAEGLLVSKSLGLNSILMMNDPDDAMRLTRREPAGGIVSLHELPDFIRLVASENAKRGQGSDSESRL